MCPTSVRKPYPSDVSNEEWSLVAPYLTLMTEAAPQCDHSLLELFNALRYVIRYGIAWRAVPNDFPPWRRSISMRSGGWRRGVSRRWRRISGHCCAWPPAAQKDRARPSSTVAPCARGPRAALTPATTVPSGKRTEKRLSPSGGGACPVHA